ncbi:MAG: serine/threonine protein kinase [Henriciella sp.]|nr:serine/threonine protein kinase [Henriciella sp.]
MNKYTIGRRLGGGTFGEVKAAVDSEGVHAAIKFFKNPGLAGVSEEELLKRFSREVRYQKMIDHENVVKVYGQNLQDEEPWFAMELADCTLKDLIANGSLTSDLRNKALFDVLSGLETIHANGLKHRDLKPANILFFEDEQRFAISDLGLSAAHDGESSTLTISGAGGGTENYAAPEMARSLKQATFETDIYSFGAILHDLFVGTRRTPYERLRGPGAIGKVIEKCTQPLPRNRYREIAALRADLYDALENLDEQPPSPKDEKVIEILGQPAWTRDDLDFVFMHVDEQTQERQFERRVVSSFSSEFLRFIAEHHPEYVPCICDYILEYNIEFEGNFDFNYCDVLANQMELVLQVADLEGKAKLLLGLLMLGTQHNRWYVERKFVDLAGPAANDALIRRMKIEAEARDIDIDGYLNHLPKSIHMSGSELHHMLRTEE